MVALTPLPGAPEPIVGVINLQGKVVPILDARLRFGLPQRVYGLYTPIILLEISPVGQMLGLVVDTVEQVVEILPHQFTTAQTIMPTNMVEQMKTQAAYLAGIAMVKQQLIVALSVETLLSLSEQHLLTQALIHQTDPKDGPGKSANEP
jgi:purine-binding chemotaxis protein CheW